VSGCSVSLVRGSPASLIVSCEGEVYVVDPGHGAKRARQLAKAVSGFEPRRAVFIVTHYHSDHLNALAEGLLERLPGGVEAVVAASAVDAAGVRDPLVRTALTFGYPLRPPSSLLLYEPLPVRVDLEVEAPGSLGPLTLTPLPGHTPGQIGVVAPDGTLYAADALFGDKVLSRYKAPYHLDPCLALETLKKLMEEAGRTYQAIQPSHGPRAEAGGPAEEMIQANIQAVERLLETVKQAAEKPATAEQIAAETLKKLQAPTEPSIAMLITNTVKGALACLHAQGQIQAQPQGPTITWKTTKP